MKESQEIPLDIPRAEPEMVELPICDRCGAVVMNTDAHDEFHKELATLALAIFEQKPNRAMRRHNG